MTTITGQITYQSLGAGVWVLETSTGVNYELHHLPQTYQTKGLEVTITGKVLTDAVSIAMVGPIFAVETVEKL